MTDCSLRGEVGRWRLLSGTSGKHISRWSTSWKVWKADKWTSHTVGWLGSFLCVRGSLCGLSWWRVGPLLLMSVDTMGSRSNDPSTIEWRISLLFLFASEELHRFASDVKSSHVTCFYAHHRWIPSPHHYTTCSTSYTILSNNDDEYWLIPKRNPMLNWPTK